MPAGRPVLLIVALAVQPCIEGELLPIRSYTTQDGLAADHIDSIVADSRGFIWFCTREGLTRFDGYRMTNFGAAEGLPHTASLSLLETRSGTYLVGTRRGLLQFHGNGPGDRFTPYLEGSPFDEPVYPLLESRSGRIWCATARGLVEVVPGGGSRRQTLPGLEWAAIMDIVEDAGGKLWVATEGGIYVLGKDGAGKRITKEDGLPNNYVNALLLDRAGRLWAGARDGLVLLRDDGASGRCGVQRVYTDKDGLSTGGGVNALAEAPDGSIWMGTQVGISRLLPGNGDAVFQNLTRSQGLSDRQIVALAADKAGNLWAGTEAAGVMRIASTGFVTFREQDGLPTDRVFSVFGDRTGTVSAVAETTQAHRTINVFDGRRFHAVVPKVYGEKPSWGQNQIVLQAQTGEWWAASKVGLCQFAPMSVEGLARNPPKACHARDLVVFRVFEDSKGGIWASAQSAQGDRLLRWDPARNAITWLDDGPGRRQLVSAFAEDHSGNIWMGLWGGGELFRYDGRHFVSLKPENGAARAMIFGLLVDHRGRLWIGSRSGLGLVENPGSAAFRVRTYGTSTGLASNTIFCLVEDSMGRIYAGTGKGLDRLDPSTGRAKHFSSSDGLAHGEFTSAYRDRSGNLWFATTQGLSRLAPAADRPPTIPSVLITDLETGGKRYPVSPAGETVIRPQKLGPSQNQLQVSFVGFNDEAGESLRYRYKLEGTDQVWHDTSGHTINYAALEPGGYRFLVKAVNSEDRESPVAAEVDFVILPPFWRRWWFEGLAMVSAVCLAVAAYRYRMREITARVKLRYEERLDERTRIARELHDTLLQSLAGVSLHLDGMAKQIGPSSETVSGQIRAVRQQVDATFREARQKVQDLRSPMLQGRALPVVMRETLEQIVAGHTVHLRMRVSGQPRSLREDLEEAVLRIGQEAVANAVRHALANEIQVLLTYDDRSLALRIQDDGRGFNVEDPRHRVGHWGLRNMEERAHGIGAQWKISAAIGCGTDIETVVPLQENK